MVEAKNISISFHKKPVLSGANLTLLPGEIGVLIGASGEGKSTLLKIIAGLVEPATGEVLFKGEKVEGPT